MATRDPNGEGVLTVPEEGDLTDSRLCEATGRPCSSWSSEEWQTEEDGEVVESWDLYCEDCGRWRDWDDEEEASE